MVNEILAEILNAMNKLDYKIIFVNGRDDIYKTATESFLKKHFDFDYELYMRKEGDRRKDDIFKEEIFFNNILPRFNVQAVFDDRLRVCKKWYSLNLNLFRFGDPESTF